MNILKINLGTTSSDKRKFLEDCLTRLDISAEIYPQNASSEISDQPLSLDETIRGARNRAKNCLSDNIDFSVGLEGGLEKINGRFNLVCVAVFFDGEDFFTGISEFYPLPSEVSAQVEKGAEFGEIIRFFYAQNPTEEVANLVSRKISFHEAIEKSISSSKICSLKKIVLK